jgi:Ca-activated chloride channel family protein
MHQLFAEGLAQITAKEMDVRLNRRPIERYEWPLAAAALALTASILIRERKRTRARAPARAAVKLTPAVATLVLLGATPVFSAVSGLNFYRDGKYPEAYEAFQDDLKTHPHSPDKDKIQFNTGAAAYQMHSYDKAAEAFSQALLSDDKTVQSKSHFNLGNTLYRRGESLKNDEKKLTDWTDALRHYDQTLKLDPNSNEAKENYEFVRAKIEELKKKPEMAKPSPSPSPPPKKPVKPSEAAKRAKAEADKAVRQREYDKALDIMVTHLRVDPTTYFYSDYIQRLEAINGIKKSVIP